MASLNLHMQVEDEDVPALLEAMQEFLNDGVEGLVVSSTFNLLTDEGN